MIRITIEIDGASPHVVQVNESAPMPAAGIDRSFRIDHGGVSAPPPPGPVVVPGRDVAGRCLHNRYDVAGRKCMDCGESMAGGILQ